MTKTRRDFLREIGCGALTATAILAGARDLMVMNALAAAAAPADYKALVCVFLFGGNDANNMVIPVDGYADYSGAVPGSFLALIPPDRQPPTRYRLPPAGKEPQPTRSVHYWVIT